MARWLCAATFCAALGGLFLASGCEDKNCPPNAPCPTPTVPPGGGSCAQVAGTRGMFWNDSCGRSGNGAIVIAQSGCAFTGTLPGLGSFSGTVSGNTLSYTLTFSDACSGQATGTASISGNQITGSYSGTSTGGNTCCSPVTGTFSFSFAPTPVATATPTVTPSL